MFNNILSELVRFYKKGEREYMNKRAFYIDNIKAILIFLVVLGHFYETVDFQGRTGIYCLIYSFHMPTFIFLSGLCFKKANNNKFFKNLVYPYVVFQVLYTIFNALEAGKGIKFQFSTPNWILWYILAMCLWHGVSNVINITEKNALPILAVSIIVALLVGFDKTVAGYFALSRTIAFFPFFFAGVCIKTLYYDKFEGIVLSPPKMLKIIACVAVSVCVAVLFIFRWDLKNRWFYQSTPYKQPYEVFIRAAILVCAVSFIIFLLVFIPKKKVPFLSYIGQNTMPIFLMHGFVVRFLLHRDYLINIPLPIVTIPILSLLVVCIFALPPVVKVLRPFYSWPFQKKNKIAETAK